jgi:streptogramin lyase
VAIVLGVVAAISTGLALGLVLARDDGGGGEAATTTPAATGTSTPDTTATTAPTTATAPTTTIDRSVDAVVHQVAQPSPGSSQLAAVSVGSDGSLWVTDYAQGRLVHLSPDGTTQQTFDSGKVGTNPGSMIVTSSGIWVVAQNQGVFHIQSNQVHALIPVDQPVGIAEAPGGDVWVTAHGGSSVIRIDGNDDQPVEARPVGDGPFGISVAGTQVFTTHDAAAQAHISLNADALSGEPVGLNPWAILATDDAVWVTNSGSTKDPTADGARGSVMRFDRATFGTNQGEQPTAVVDVGLQPRSMWRQDDGTIWVTVWGDDRVVRLDGASGQELAAYCMGAGSHPNGITGRGKTVYVVTEGDGVLHSIDTGARPSRACPASSAAPASGSTAAASTNSSTP